MLKNYASGLIWRFHMVFWCHMKCSHNLNLYFHLPDSLTPSPIPKLHWYIKICKQELSGLLYHASCHHRPMAWERSGVQSVRPVVFGKRGCFTCARSSLLARRLNTPAPTLPHQYTFKLSKFQLRFNSNLYSFRLWTSHLNPPLLHAFNRFTLVVCCRYCCCSNCGFLRNRWNSRLVIIIDDGCIRRIY